MSEFTKVLIEADKVDSQGDMFPQAVLEKIVEDFKADPKFLPVSVGFDPCIPPVGRVLSLEMDGANLMATVEVNDDPADDEELAAGGRMGNSVSGVVGTFELTEVTFTKTKVK